jgi:ATP-binding cassette subfamily B multidrug efflux pump
MRRINRLLSAFERIIDPTTPPDRPPPNAGLWAFYGSHLRDARLLLAGLFATGLITAGMDVAIPVFIGRIVSLIAHHAPETLMADAWPQFAGMALVLLILRPAGLLLHNLMVNQAINPSVANLIRWQNHFHVVRQSWTFFQNDFAGRIANRVMQTGPALRESVVATVDAVWYITVYGASAVFLLGRTDWRLAVPILLWFVAYAIFLRRFVPRMRERSRAVSEARSQLTGRVVDSYTNILTVKLFARAEDEDAFVREAMEDHTDRFRHQTRLITGFVTTLALINAVLVVATGTLAVALFVHGHVAVGVVATALPLTWQLVGTAGWVARNVNSIFENVGVVQDGMRSIDVPRQMPDPPDAVELAPGPGRITFEGVRFGYGTARGVLRGIDLTIAPGERVGLVGPSGAGKSTLVNLLLGFYRPEAGRVLIDGQDIATVTQESLRGRIAMVTQDTSLLHRSIRENIGYGRRSASEAEILAAARRAEAHEFITTLEDWHGRTGYDAHVGERGVKLSGGQRQRIAIARVILKDAPILVLDEATSALDSEAEAAIQAHLEALMRGRTVIAIAHRLSTIARMDRLVVLDHGEVAEAGTHADLLAAGGVYARLWQRQSGGFDPDAAEPMLHAAQ